IAGQLGRSWMGLQLTFGRYAAMSCSCHPFQPTPIQMTRKRPKRNSRATPAGTIVQQLVGLLSGEWILSWTPYTANGGTVVAARAIWLSTWIFGSAFLVKTSLGEGKVAEFDLRQGAADFVEILPWLGAIFAGVYAALYTRF